MTNLTISAIFDTKFKKKYIIPAKKIILNQFISFLPEFDYYLNKSFKLEKFKRNQMVITWKIIDTDKNPKDVSRTLKEIKKDFSKSINNHHFYNDSDLFFYNDTGRTPIGRFILKSLTLAGGDKNLPRQLILSPKELSDKWAAEIKIKRQTDSITYAEEIADIKKQTDKFIIDNNLTELIDNGIPLFPKRQTINFYRGYLKRLEKMLKEK